MKKILVILGILTLLCVNCAFADDEIDVFTTLNNANNNTVNSISDYANIMAHTQSYIRNNNISNFDSSIHKFIMYPTSVSFASDRSSLTIDFIFQFIPKEAAGTWGVISYPNEGVFNLGIGFNDLAIGYTVNNGVVTYKVTCVHTYSSDSYVFTNEFISRPNDVDHSYIWRITYRELQVYGLVSDYKNISSWNGVFFSIWSNIDVLPTYYGYYAGYDTGNWDRRYTQNVNYSIPVMRSDSSVNNNATTIISNDSGITIPTNESDIEGLTDFNISNIEKLWEKLKSLIIGLISQLKGVIYLFGSLFSWLPDEIVALVVSGLLFGVIILIIHFIRGK